MRWGDGSSHWLANGGAYAIIFSAWGVIAVVFILMAVAISKKFDSRNDGCLLQVAVPIMTLAGGGLGLFFVPFPAFVIGSPAGALIANCLLFGFWTLAQRKHGR